MTTSAQSATQPGFWLRLWHRLGSPKWFYEITHGWPRWFGGVAAVLLAVGCFWGLAIAPADYQQGDSFRIMYIHVPAAMLAQSIYLLMGTCGVVVLVWRMKLADMVLANAVPIGMAMAALALFTGSVWGAPTWGTWWVWDARTTSTLALLFLYFGVYALRQSITSADAASRACAVLAIVGMINVPIIKYSVEWWSTLHQPPLRIVDENPSMPPSMYWPLLINALGFYCLLGALLLYRTRLEILMRERGTQWVGAIILGTQSSTEQD